MDRSSKATLLFNGYFVFENAIDHPAMDRACEALVEWHKVQEATDANRHCHAPEFVHSGGLAEVSEQLQLVVERIFGKGNAKGRALQLASSLGGKALVPRHKKPHIDNHPNALEAAERRAQEKGIPREEEFINFPEFNAIVGLALTETWVNVWPNSQSLLANFFRTEEGSAYSDLQKLWKLLPLLNERILNPLPLALEACGMKRDTVIHLNRGDVLVMNHLLMHSSCDPERMKNPQYVVPGKGELSARLYQRFETIDPPPSMDALRNPWHGYKGLVIT